MTDKSKGNRVWIELEVPWGDPDIDNIAKRRAELASNMLSRLGASRHFFWHPSKAKYCCACNESGSFTELQDKGEWFSLDYLGRDLPKAGPLETTLGPVENICSVPKNQGKPLQKILRAGE